MSKRLVLPALLGKLAPAPQFVSEFAEPITASATTFEHTLPDNIQPGDMILTLWKTNETSSSKVGLDNVPAGWTWAGTDRATALWWKIAEGGETSVSASWTGAASGNPTVHSLVYRNVDPVDPFLRPPEPYASSSTTTTWQAPDSAPATSDSTDSTNSQLDNFSSFMDGSTYVGIVYSATTSTLNPSTIYQPNLLERQQTVNARDHRHFSVEGITENGGLYNDQRARWSHGSSYNGGFHATLRAPRTQAWLDTCHVAYRRTSLIYSSFDNTLVVPTDVAHLDGMLALVMAQNGNEGNTIRGFDLTFGTNTWMTDVNNHTYYGIWDAAGRSARSFADSTRLCTTFIIANANTADPVSLNIQRSVHSNLTGRPYRFWTRPNQLVVGALRTGNYDSVNAVLGEGNTSITVERQEHQRNTASGNQTAQIVEGRGLADGIGYLPAILAPTAWSGNAITWAGINHSTESSPARKTPTIVGTPVISDKSLGGSGLMTITKPSGCQVGEILLMLTSFQTGGELLNTGEGAPAGFEPISNGVSGASGGSIEMWMKVVDGTEPDFWTPTANLHGSVVMIRMTNILPINGYYRDSDTTALLNPHPTPTPDVFHPGIVLRTAHHQTATATVIDIDTGVDVRPDSDVPQSSTPIHMNITGEVIAAGAVPAATYTVTPFPTATARTYIYHLDAEPV